ncbi:MAG TPA: (Fe-S)-binding protein [Candidatus Acidoferrum sp.]|nr:(Fe-S)-binding protein [Candidatus Acidoferrum sp.]
MELAHLNALWKCNKCGACTAVCPLYQETVNEGMAARGKLALLEAVVDGVLAPSQGLREKIENCLLCGACAQNCPSLVPTTDLFLDARAELASLFGVPLPVRMFLFALRTPGIMRVGMPVVRLAQRAGAAILAEGGAGALLPKGIRVAARSAPSVPARPYHARVVPITDGDSPERVAYFAGCFMNWIYADTAEATRLALTLAGHRVDSPSVVCCGLPHKVYGDVETARRLARQNIEALEGYAAIVTDCASCGAALREYRDLLADDPQFRERARVVSSRVADVSEFLMEHESPHPLGELPLRVTYHEPCHLGRGQGVKVQPREMLKSIPGVELVEMKGADVCCGGAGSFCITHPDLSGKVGATKVENILATRADVVASGCPSCMLQLRTLLQQRGVSTRVCHPVDLLAEGYRKAQSLTDSATHPSDCPSNPILSR